MDVDANAVIDELLAQIADLSRQVAILKVLVKGTTGPVNDGD